MNQSDYYLIGNKSKMSWSCENEPCEFRTAYYAHNSIKFIGNNHFNEVSNYDSEKRFLCENCYNKLGKTTEEIKESKISPEWVDIKEVFKILKDENSMWSGDTKYLELRVDTRHYIDGTFRCLIKDRNGNLITLEELKEKRMKF